MGVKVLFDDPSARYFPGDTVSGRVEYTCDSSKKVRSLTISFKGNAKTSWDVRTPRQTSRTNTSSESYVTHHADEEYFNTSYRLLEATEIEAGNHSYPFAYVLPDELPPSFEGKFGRVKYTLRVALDRPWRVDRDTKTPFTVVSRLDLNAVAWCSAPLNILMVDWFSWICCKSGPVRVQVVAPASGFCSGQEVPVDVAVANVSDVRLTQILVKLVQIVAYHCRTPVNASKYWETEITKIKFDGVGRNSSKNYQKILTIPQLPPSNLNHCNIIDIEYQLKVKCCMECCHKNMNDKRTITIGTVPLVGFQPPPYGTQNESITVPYPVVPGQSFYPNIQSFSMDQTSYPKNSYPVNQPTFSNPYAQQPSMNPSYGP